MVVSGSRLGALVALAGLASFPTVGGATQPDPGDDAKLLLIVDTALLLETEAVQSALDTVVAGLDPSQAVGLQLLGESDDDGVDSDRCEATDLAIPILAGDRDEFVSPADGYESSGETPIDYALTVSDNDEFLGELGRRSILLVAGSGETCGSDPCQTARDLAAEDIGLTINVVGFDVDQQARDQLRCIAEAGHGTYFDAHDVTTLSAAMERLAARAFRPAAISGDPVTGSPGHEGAPELAPGHTYVDAIGLAAQPRYYLIRRTMPGSSIHVGFSATPGQLPPRGGPLEGFVSLGLNSLGGSPCDSEIPLGVLSAWSLVTIQASAWDDPDEGQDPCIDDDTLLLDVSTHELPAEMEGTPFELVVDEEPRIEPGAILRDGFSPGEVHWQALVSDGAAGPIAGGASFHDAPRVEPGSYTSEILPGETAVFSVPLDWGQWLEAQVDSEGVEEASIDVSINVIGPNRGDVTEESIDGTDAFNKEPLYWPDPTVVAAATGQVRWWNRNEIGSTLGASTPGNYYVAVSAALDEDGDSYLIPFTFTVAVFGVAGEDAPPYVDAPDAAGVPTSTPGQTAAPPTTTPSTTEPSVAFGDNDGRSGDDGGTSPTLLGALGVAGVGLVGSGAYRLIRLRRRPG